jgi:hypothetical protein
MSGFTEVLEEIMQKKGVAGGLGELVEILNGVPEKAGAPDITVAEVEGMKSGEGDAHPWFFQALQEGLGLERAETERVLRAYFNLSGGCAS